MRKNRHALRLQASIIHIIKLERRPIHTSSIQGKAHILRYLANELAGMNVKLRVYLEHWRQYDCDKHKM